MFLDMSVHHLDVTTSEHKPLWIALEGMDSSYQKPFYFEQMWMTDMGCSEKIEAIWSERSTDPWDTRVIKKIEKCGKELSWWSKKCFGNVPKELDKKNKAIEGGKTGSSSDCRFKPYEILGK